MSGPVSNSSWKVASVGTYLFLMTTIFVTELAVMEMGSPLLLRLPRLPAALVDAAILVVVFSLPLMLFCLRLRSEEVGTRRSIWGLYVRVMAAIFAIEFLIMLLLPEIIPRRETELLGLIDATLTLLFSAPPMWWMFRRLEQRYRRVPLADYLNSPPMLYVLLLFMVFLADLQQELLLPIFLPEGASLAYKIANSVLTTLFIAPILWLLVTRPLRRMALSEQARTRAVYAQVIDAVITFDAYGIIECFNPGAERIFGYSADEMTGKHAAQLFDDGEQVLDQLVRSAVVSGSNPAKVGSRELLGCRCDGTLVTMDVSISRMVVKGKPEFLLIMRDVTERKHAARALQASETRFRQIFEQTDDAVIFLHPRNYSIIDINTTTAEMFGYGRDEIREVGLARLCRSEDYWRIKALISKVARGESAQLENIVGLRRDGSDFIVSMRVKIMLLQEVEILYCTFRDVTDRVRMEVEAREIQSKLIQANKMTSLGLMVSGVAHEINNPNNFILTNAQLLERSWEDVRKVLREYCAEHGEVQLGGMSFAQLDSHSPQLFAGIIDGARRIGEIVGNLKGFARQESVSLDGDIDINQVARSAISILHHEIVRFTSDFAFDPSDNLPRVSGNRQQLGQVIVNLLMNACQSLPDKHRAVRLRTFLDHESAQVVVAVRDEGCGMSDATARLIMEPFFTTKLDAGGTGLGLSICRSIVKDHHGTLDFSSEPGQGTTFFLRLPVPDAAAKEVNL